MNFIKSNFFLILLILLSIAVLLVNVRINVFKYDHFDFGKFDLGNMTQMVWNVTQGRGLTLTDYFGTNLPRWSMSHVDPILYLFVPLFILFPHALTLVFSQLALVIFSSVIIYKIAELYLKSKLSAFLLGFSWVLFPATGYLTTQTGFHGVTAAIPFFLLAFYIFEKMYVQNRFTVTGIILFWLMLVINMSGKEQIPLYVILYGVFILFLRNKDVINFKHGLTTLTGKLGLSMIFVGVLWFIIAFFVIIPAYAPQRIKGYESFLDTINIDDAGARNVGLDNFFLNRYDEFGDSYTDVALGIIANPDKAAEVFFGGDKPENLIQTFKPVGYLPLVYPAIFVFSVPDLMINYLTTAGGIGTSEISNHRVSMIIPISFLATIYAIGYLSGLVSNKKIGRTILIALSGIVFLLNLYTSHVFNNPVYLWMYQAVQKRIMTPVFAKTDKNIFHQDLKIGDVIKLSELEDKDRECATLIVSSIPDNASVSGPDSLGAHLAQRETYAIFPVLYNQADYVIVDIFARKILTILDLNVELNRDIISNLIKSDKYILQFGCGNYFVFKRSDFVEKAELLPMQERFEYEAALINGNLDGREKNLPYTFFQGVDLHDYYLPEEFKIGERKHASFAYYRAQDGGEKDTSLEAYIMFTTFVNKKDGSLYQFANLPSIALKQPEEWEEGRYYAETVELTFPDFIGKGEYLAFIGMGNKIRTRSMYLGDVTVK